MSSFLYPWRHPAELWRSTSHVALGLVTASVAFIIVFVLIAITASLLVTLLFAIPAAWVLFAAARGAAMVERSRTASVLGTAIVDPVPQLMARSWLGRLGERIGSRSRWFELLHSLILFPVALLGFALTFVAWGGALALLGLPAYVAALPGGTAKFGLFEVAPGLDAIATALVGLAIAVAIAPWITLASARAQGALTRGLLGRASEAEVAVRLRRLEEQRLAAVSSAEVERRRIERDLHDGAQQRLVALAAHLGSAREKLETDPETAKIMVGEAHEESKVALKEIRDLVRGIHPVILEDRGLDAALSSVVSRAPVPVALQVRVDPRPPAAVESAAYFVVAEALTNVARHAQASRARVAIERARGRLIIEVHDDGVGGADASLGTGLQGLRERVSAMNGSMQIISPPGGPTTLFVELPCES